MNPIISELTDGIRKAAAERSPLRIRGSGSKDFFGHKLEGDVLDVSAHRGGIDYEPREPGVTGRAGAAPREIEAALAEGGQMLACEPPFFGPNATLGGCVASGFSG